ncbi:hypothetical protein AAG906_031289 [Vitis piasezkii]
MHERHVLEQLRPRRNLKKLTIASYGGSEFPSWMKDPSFPIMTHLILKDGKRCKSLPALGQLSSLKVLHIEGLNGVMAEWEYWFCPDAVNEDDANLEKLPNGLQTLTCLEQLEIRRCPKLESFPETGLPPMLRSLKVIGCENLKWLPHNYNSCALEFLDITSCPSLRCFPNCELPTTLKSLWIQDYCENLESLPEGMMHHNSTCLEILTIKKCSSLKSFSTRELPPPLRNLRFAALDNLVLEGYPNLKILPECLHSLKSLRIINCEGLECFPARGLSTPTLTSLLIARLESFPEDGMPPNLISLRISCCENLKKPISAFHTLTSLSSLTIQDVFPDMVSFPDEECLLPISLTSLRITEMESLAYLSLQNLISLRSLDVKCCPNLRSLGRKENIGPTSLTFHTLK